MRIRDKRQGHEQGACEDKANTQRENCGKDIFILHRFFLHIFKSLNTHFLKNILFKNPVHFKIDSKVI